MPTTVASPLLSSSPPPSSPPPPLDKVPFVIGPNGERFYSDRFYINKTANSSHNKQHGDDGSRHTSNAQDQTKPHIAQHDPFQTFDLPSFINSLDLKAAIVGTYVLDPLWMSNDMPTVFPSSCSTSNNDQKKSPPILVLHGHKALQKTLDKLVRQRNRYLKLTSAKNNIKKQEQKSCSSPVNSPSGSKRKRRSSSSSISPRKSLSKSNNNNSTGTSPQKAFEQQLFHLERDYGHFDDFLCSCSSSSDADDESNSSGKTDNVLQKQEGTDVGMKRRRRPKNNEKGSNGNDNDNDSDMPKTFFDSSVYFTKVRSAWRMPGLSETDDGVSSSGTTRIKKTTIDSNENNSGKKANIQNNQDCGGEEVIVIDVSSDDDDDVVEIIENPSFKTKVEQSSDSEIEIIESILPYQNRNIDTRTATKKEEQEQEISTINGSTCNTTKAAKNEGMEDDFYSLSFFPTTTDDDIDDTNKDDDSSRRRVSSSPSASSSAMKKTKEKMKKKHETNLNAAGTATIEGHRHQQRQPVKLKTCMGVHHPKFWLLLENSGSLVVIISTSNLTRPTEDNTVEGSWIQRFYSSSKKKDDHINNCNNDFGYVLSDFLSAQDVAAEEGSLMTPKQFIRDYFHFETLDEFRRAFDFEKASVHLVSTIPGHYAGYNSSTVSSRVAAGNNQNPNSNRSSSVPETDRNRGPSLCYGSQRVSQLLSTLQSLHINDTTMISSQDRLLLQPTSITKWDRSTLKDIAESFLLTRRRQPPKSREQGSKKNSDCAYHATCDFYEDEEELLHRVDLLWPTQEYIMKGRKKRRVQTKRDCVSDSNAANDDEDGSFLKELHSKIYSNGQKLEQRLPAENKTSSKSKVYQPTHLFFSSEMFNKFDLSVLSCFKQYKSSDTCSSSSAPPPHFKSYARVLHQPPQQSVYETDEEEHSENLSPNVINLLDDSPMHTCATNTKSTHLLKQNSNEGGIRHENSTEHFAWFLMTSANLSPGAQGRSIPDHMSLLLDTNLYEYANFELGVLFVSSHQKIYTAASRRTSNTDSDSHNGNRCGIMLQGASESKTITKNYSETTECIPLPVPYRVHSLNSYQASEEEADYVETPYFHEIPAGSATMGNMLLTPLGRSLTKDMK